MKQIASWPKQKTSEPKKKKGKHSWESASTGERKKRDTWWMQDSRRFAEENAENFFAKKTRCQKREPFQYTGSPWSTWEELSRPPVLEPQYGSTASFETPIQNFIVCQIWSQNVAHSQCRFHSCHAQSCHKSCQFGHYGPLKREGRGELGMRTWLCQNRSISCSRVHCWWVSHVSKVLSLLRTKWNTLSDMPSTARTSLKTQTFDAAAAVRVLRDVDSSCHGVQVGYGSE
jgi:hypothetical protein